MYIRRKNKIEHGDAKKMQIKEESNTVKFL